MYSWSTLDQKIINGIGPKSRQWAIKELIGQFPNHADRTDRTEASAIQIVDAMLGAPYPWLLGWNKGKDSEMTAGEVVTWANDMGLLFIGGQTGWLDRSGVIFTCHYAAHEKLLYNILKMSSKEAETAGWTRLDKQRWRCAYRLSTEQKRVLLSFNHTIDRAEEAKKPAWNEKENVIKFR